MEAKLAVTSCTVHPPAKLNLCLDLLGKRPDGFHELKSVMATIGLRDTLRVVSTAGSAPRVAIRSLRGGSADVPRDGRNLVVRALDLLRERAGVSAGAGIDLVKRIPSQAGLGGGSSDAAGALVAGARVWGVDWPVAKLAALGAELGSDIPFFVHALAAGGPQVAVASGRGENIQPLATAGGQPVVVLKPTAGLSTVEVYRACEASDYLASPKHCDALTAALRNGTRGTRVPGVVNGLQAAALRVAPWLGAITQAFERMGFTTHQLSGSGSAYFGMAATVGEAQRLAARLRAMRFGETWVTRIA